MQKETTSDYPIPDHCQNPDCRKPINEPENAKVDIFFYLETERVRMICGRASCDRKLDLKIHPRRKLQNMVEQLMLNKFTAKHFTGEEIKPLSSQDRRKLKYQIKKVHKQLQEENDKVGLEMYRELKIFAGPGNLP